VTWIVLIGIVFIAETVVVVVLARRATERSDMQFLQFLDGEPPEPPVRHAHATDRSSPRPRGGDPGAGDLPSVPA
jgi:hypothetical protein